MRGGGDKRGARTGNEITSERPLCHESSTSANDVGAAEV